MHCSHIIRIISQSMYCYRYYTTERWLIFILVFQVPLSTMPSRYKDKPISVGTSMRHNEAGKYS